MAQSGIVLKAITRAILVHWLMGNKLRGVWGAYSVGNFHASGQRLPRVISCLPPASTLQQNTHLHVIYISRAHLKYFGRKLDQNEPIRARSWTVQPAEREANFGNPIHDIIALNFSSNSLRNQHVCCQWLEQIGQTSSTNHSAYKRTETSVESQKQIF